MTDPSPAPDTPIRILIVEDESLAAMALEEVLGMLGFAVVGIEDNADDAVAAAERLRPDIVMMDIRLLGPRDGIEAAVAIRKRTGIRCIFTSAFGDPETRHRAAECDPFGFVRKPYFPAELQRALSQATETLRGRV
ncbi:response regulator [Azospirillum melinis]|uniref:Response regulator n=1 Tax=Azospirillum melinis TaxID=328839 RepID=A0ABX2KF26_9PROT|nr:response regulator [Azospirillum melinis]MBP2307918.1 DNA-binding NarL/FixJ family response regulator [Azospirillum melinis]NUB00368.1 response regulator [Azospirillum melinis]